MNDLDRLDADMRTIVEEIAAPRATAAALADIARDSLAEFQAQNRRALGRVPEHTTTVDGRIGADERSVRPDGRIVYDFHLVGDVLGTIARLLEQASPVLTGAYRDANKVFADGRDVTGQDLDGIAAREVVFINTRPYARKIEGGLSPQAPEGVYEAVAVLAAQRFGNQARIRFQYRSPLIAYRPAGTAGAAASRRGGRERVTRSPAIVVTVQ